MTLSEEESQTSFIKRDTKRLPLLSLVTEGGFKFSEEERSMEPVWLWAERTRPSCGASLRMSSLPVGAVLMLPNFPLAQPPGGYCSAPSCPACICERKTSNRLTPNEITWEPVPLLPSANLTQGR